MPTTQPSKDDELKQILEDYRDNIKYAYGDTGIIDDANEEAVAAIQAHQSRAVEIATLRARRDEVGACLRAPHGGQMSLGELQKRRAELNHQLATLTKDKGEDRE
jgi:hypothetical protein